MAKSELEETILSLLPHDYGQKIDVNALCLATDLDAEQIVNALEACHMAEEKNGELYFTGVGHETLEGTHPEELSHDPGREWTRYTRQNRAKGRHRGAP